MPHRVMSIVASCFVALVGASAARAVPVQWNSGPGNNGHFYDVVAAPRGITRTAAADAAAALGGYLATPVTAEENAFIFSLISADANLWLIDAASNGIGPWTGGVRSGGSFAWVSGEPFSFSNFAAGEPNNFGGNEDFIEYFGHGALIGDTWNDYPDDATTSGRPLPVAFVVEFDAIPEPASFALLALAALPLIRRR
ncbi:MAG: hypothetical protein GC162_09190 [Planctomycetes bacterium]|nr:hypothetical protein [Planctomycetota bacterium]